MSDLHSPIDRSDTRSPISVLPVELFIRIADFVASDDPPTWIVRGDTERELIVTENILGFLVITHVCSRWRSVCHGALELWGSATSALAEKSTLHVSIDHSIPTVRILVPPILPALRVLSFSTLWDLPMMSVLDILAQTPLLERLHFNECHWSMTPDEARQERPKLVMSRLTSLTLDDLYTLRDGAWYNNCPLEYLYNHIDLPSDTLVTLSPCFSDLDFEDGSAIRLLQRLFARVLADIRRGPSPPLCVHIAWLDSPKPIYLTALPTFGDLAIFKYPSHPRHRELQRAKIGLHTIGLEEVLLDESIVNTLKGVEMLSIPTDRITRISGNYLFLEEALFSVFSDIRILRISQTTKNNSTDTWLFLHELAEFVRSDTLKYPRLEEIWISPIVSVAVDAHVVRKVAGIVAQRDKHPDNRIHTVRLGIPRPSGDSEEGVSAAELESLVPNVEWAA
ncbi:unnamed protein product [Peniophora sp. CBMAI 1063]|nr:unnamed protein product [Peniophora sp. CBMAI 1063]